MRFAPGWPDKKTNEYWTYAFLWYLDDASETNSMILEKNLTAYYSGLVGRNIGPRKIPAEKIIPVKASIKKIATDEGDLQTYSGSIDMLDYMAQEPITLNCIVHLISCAGQPHMFIFYEISPQPFTGTVWNDLNRLRIEFACKKSPSK